MNTRTQLFCLHLTIPFVVAVGVAGFVITGFLPPPSPGLKAEEIASVFSPDNLVMRIGVSVMVAGTSAFLGPAVAFRHQLKRIEGRFSALADVQMLAAAVGVVEILVPGYLFLAASFRPSTPPETVAVLVNLGFFLLVAGVGPAIAQNVAIGVCILSGDSEGIHPYPRWLGYANLWLALTLAPGVLVPFFTTGPFTYAGVFGFWMPVTGFFIWLSLMWWFTLRAVRSQAGNNSSTQVVAAEN